MTLLKHRGSAALLLVVAFLLSSCQKPEPIGSVWRNQIDKV